MRIRRVFVEKLFGFFNHDIRMNMDDRITIIHAPNGFGKTAILRMIDGLFNSRYSHLVAFPFGAFGVELDDGTLLRVEKQNASGRRGKRDARGSGAESLVFTCNKRDRYVLTLMPDGDELPFSLGVIEDLIPGLYRVGPETWRTEEGEELELHELLARYSHMLPGPPIGKQREPEWFRKIIQSLDVRFIRSDRLVANRQPRAVRTREKRPLQTPAVMSYSEEVASAIRATLTQYARLSQSLDRTFPSRLVTQSPSTDLTKQEITDRLSEFEAKRKRLIESGLLDQETDPQFQVPQTIDEKNASVLSVYVSDVQEKLAVFDVLAGKIDLFKSIINRRFKHKRMTISRDSGILFTTDSGQPLPATSLSSGEQHEVVMLYELLFKLRPDSLILIDEPEISLHVAWQEEFLRDLHEMTDLSGFDVLIATHSPEIISDRWDLTVELRDSAELEQAVR